MAIRLYQCLAVNAAADVAGIAWSILEIDPVLGLGLGLGPSRASGSHMGIDDVTQAGGRRRPATTNHVDLFASLGGATRLIIGHLASQNVTDYRKVTETVLGLTMRFIFRLSASTTRPRLLTALVLSRLDYCNAILACLPPLAWPWVLYAAASTVFLTSIRVNM